MLQNTEAIGPKDHAEAVAIFRAQVIAPLCISDLARGERIRLLRELSEQSFTPPCATASKTFSATTIERWLYRYRRGGLPALKPMSRERGAALVLNAPQRELLVQIRREHPSASAELIVSTLEHDPDLGVVVNLAVEHHLDGAVFVGQRLMTGAQIDDAQPAVCKRCMRVAVQAGVVGTTVGHDVAHPGGDAAGVRGQSFERHHSCDAAHQAATLLRDAPSACCLNQSSSISRLHRRWRWSCAPL